MREQVALTNNIRPAASWH